MKGKVNNLWAKYGEVFIPVFMEDNVEQIAEIEIPKESFKEMKKRHDEEIEALQDNCLHIDVSPWTDFMWAPGHFGLPVKYCKFCEKVLERKEPEIELN